MPTNYNGYNSPYAGPAYFETSPIVNQNDELLTTFSFNAGNRITIDVSANNGASWTVIDYQFPADKLFLDSQSLVDYLNQFVQGTAPNNIEWYIPGNSIIINGTLIFYSYGIRVGCRTKSLVGINTLLRIGQSNGFGKTKLNVSVGAVFRGSTGFTELLTQPQSFEPFIASSVNNYQKGLRERDVAIISAQSLFLENSRNLLVESTNGTSIEIKAISSFGQYNGSVNKPIFITPLTSITLTSANLGAAFVANTWYYVYSYIDAGTLKYEISTTIVDDSLIFKTGDVLRRYLFSFVTDGVGSIRPFIRISGRTTYYTPLEVLTNGVDVVPTAVNLQAVVPSHSHAVLLQTSYNATSVLAPSLFSIRRNGSTDLTYVGFAANEIRNDTVWIPQFNQKFDYNVADATDKLTVKVLAYLE